MQPPPRKVKITQVLRNVQNEQLSRIHAKHQSDLDLLDDVREFAKQRSITEKIYAQSLQKLVAQFQQKREGYKEPEVHLDDNKEHRTIATVWKNLLNEMDKVAKLRLTSAETYSSQVAERAKVERMAKVQRMKRVEEIMNLNHEEMYNTVHEMTKAKKSYVEVERIAQEVREKAIEAENKLKKGTVRFYQSRSTLEKASAKLSSRREACDKRSCHARNEYLLALGAANAHQLRYHTVDLQQLLNVLDGDIYKRFKNYVSVLSTTEVESNVFSRTCFEKVLAETELIDREYQLKVFLQDNLVFTKMLQYHFDPVENDNIDSVVIDDMEALYLEREARKWATNVARDSKAIEDLNNMVENLKKIEGAQKEMSIKGSSESVANTGKDGLWKMHDLKEAQRKVETSKVKADAKLEILRTAGVNVDQWLFSAFEAVAKEAEAEAQARLQSISSSPGQGDSTFDDSYLTNNNESQNSHSSSLLSHDAPKSFRCSALYTYEAQREDEITIFKAEELEVLEDSEGDGWIKAKNSTGAIGYIPESYILKDNPSIGTAMDTYSISSSHIVPSSSSSSLAADNEVQGLTHRNSGQKGVCMAKAVFDYTGESVEELSFQEGAIIKILRKDENGVDDGFWEGEINGQVGVFPSLLVEEIGGSDDSQSSEIKTVDTKTESPPEIILPSRQYEQIDDDIPQKKPYGRPTSNIYDYPEVLLRKAPLLPAVPESSPQPPERNPEPKYGVVATSKETKSPEPIFAPPGFEPPNLPLPPSPQVLQEVPNHAIYTEIDHSTATDSIESNSPPFASPPSLYPPQLPKTVVLKPVRAAPPPPKPKKQNSFECPPPPPPPPPPIPPPVMDDYSFLPPPPLELLYDEYDDGIISKV